MITVPVVVLPHGEGLGLPEKHSEGAAGFDLRAAIAAPVELAPGRRALIPCGITLAIPDGWEGQVRPRSGLAWKHGITLINAPGTIDADYRGELMVPLVNLGDAPFTVQRGDRIAQLLFGPVHPARFVAVEALDERPRGDRGFGSTGRR